LLESANPINPESENATMADQGQDVVEFIKENRM
jgi:hypothetical protein